MRTVLIVEDHKVTLDSLCLILEHNGYRCLTASNAEKALQLFASNQVDLVLLDYGLPDHDGGRLATELKNMTGSLPIVMISGAGDLQEKPPSVDTLFAKPTDPSLLLKTIADLLN
jgi:two-component system KDP operon response regulator KdpE